MDTTPLLCTAEAFGFGPSAALRQIVPYLREDGFDMSYLGCGWTLEMHTPQMYRQVHDVNVREAQGRGRWREALGDTPAMLSVCDLEAAKAGVDSGAATVLYDVLVWFRRPAPEIYGRVQRLVCPDFFGVREALAESGLTDAQVVPPLMPPPADPAGRGDKVVVNLGGLQTPYTDITPCVRYAQRMVDAVREVFGAPWVLTSQAVGQHLVGCEVRTVSPAEARDWVGQARCAFLTGGIGNIMDAAGLAAPVCFLPPMSQSQGQQLALLRRHMPNVHTIAWHEVGGMDPIDYHQSHDVVMPAIAERIASAGTPAGVDRLHACLRQVRDALAQPDAGQALHEGFVKRFGRDDGRKAAAAIAAGLQ